MQRKGFLIAPVLSLLMSSILVDFAAAQSFNCREARRADEVQICQDAELSHLDEQLASLYTQQRQRLDKAQQQILKKNQRFWLRQRGDCGRNRNCIANLYQERLDQLSLDVKLPAAVGECINTTIAKIADRFGDRLPEWSSSEVNGTSILFGNGAFQASYDWEAAIARSRVGDRVRMCLISIPQNCPPGDERGRVYTTTNQRTGEAWTLADSQHSCGGA